MTQVIAAVVGCLAGVMAGVFGVGGGILFVPVLVALGLDQHQATGTSLLAIMPTVAVGTWRNSRYGNVRWKPAALIGVGAVASAQAGVFAAEALPQHVLKKLFAALLVAVAAQIAYRARSRGPVSPDPER